MKEEGKKIVLIGPVYPYKCGISHYTGMMYRALSKKYQPYMGRSSVLDHNWL